jgi:hypothetical protein
MPYISKRNGLYHIPQREFSIIVSEPYPVFAEAWLLIAKFFLFLTFTLIFSDYVVVRKTLMGFQQFRRFFHNMLPY